MSPVYKDYIWGGERLKKELNKECDYDKVAESWEISANSNGNCTIINEEYKNKTLAELFNDKVIKEDVFGKNCLNMSEFPLLIKFIDAKDNLSIQVHPDDNYAKKIGQPNGKNEIWYIMDCDDDSKLIAGLNQKLNYEELKKAIYDNNIKDYLNYVEVAKGDSIYIPAGAIHAILKGCLICEIQQNSDTTYRVYDWDRVDKYGKSRELHKKESLETINIDILPKVKHSNNENMVEILVSNEYFKIEKINCNGSFEDKSDLNTFFAMSVVEGEGCIYTSKEKINIKKGDSFLIPATLGEYKLIGKMELLKTSIT